MNRHQRRAAAALSHKRARALLKFIPEGFKDVDPKGQAVVALRLAYRAWHLGRLTAVQARAVGCRIGRSG